MWSALQFYPQLSGFSIREGSRRRRAARRRGQRREWEEFEALDARMKKFPLKLLADWAAAAVGGGCTRSSPSLGHSRSVLLQTGTHCTYPNEELALSNITSSVSKQVIMQR